MEIFQWPSLILTHTGIRISALASKKRSDKKNKKNSVRIKKIVKLQQFSFSAHAEIGFPYGGSCGNLISKWGVMRKSDFFSLLQRQFHNFFENVWKFFNGRRLY